VGERIELEVRSNLFNVANQGKTVLDGWLHDNLRALEALAARVDPRALPPGIQEWLHTIRTGSSGLLRLGVTDARHVLVAHDPPFDDLGRPTVGVDVSGQPFAREIARTHRLVVSDVVRSRLGRPVPIVIFTQPILRDGKYLGYIGGVVDLGDWNGLVGKVTGKWDIAATLLDRNGLVIASNRPGVRMMQPYDWRANGAPRLVRSGLWHLQPRRSAGVPAVERLRQSAYVTEIDLSAATGWKLVLEAPMAPYQESLHARYYFTMTLLLAIFALALAGAAVVSRRTVRSIERLDRISVGLPDRIARREAVDWPESRLAETDSLTRNFKSTAGALAARFDELAALNASLERRVAERTAELARTNEELNAGIEERKRGERARRLLEEDLLRSRKLDSLGVLAGGIAHDFNNLLTAILGNIEMAMSGLPPGDGRRDRLAEAEKASVRARDLTQQLLTFSRGGAPVRETASVGDLVADTAGFALRGSNVRLDYVRDEALWPAEIDPGQISQVINNLIINADQAMPDGGTVTIRTANATVSPGDTLPLPPGDYVTIAVADRGNGIPPENLERIFDPYFTTKRTGSGLGLATVYSIVRRHGGHVEVSSRPGEGASFKVWLPAAKGAAPPARERLERVTTGTGRILVMDDEPFVREVVGAMLERAGYDPSFAEHGEEAIARYSEAKAEGRPFSAVIMDLTIPGGMGGVEASRRLREIDAAVRIVVASGYSNDPVMARFRDYGFVGVVRKPFRIAELTRVIGEAVSPGG
jgi:signal transduction histidine kinase/CheY-like chemotaxis protein